MTGAERTVERALRSSHRAALRGAERLLGPALRLTERQFGLDTQEYVGLARFGLEHAEREQYEPSSWFALRRSLHGIALTGDDVFVDLGSGKGRIVYLAASRHPFRKVIGVELARELNEVAAQNLVRFRASLRASEVHLVTADAADYELPDDVTVVYLFNPFTGEVFRRALANVVASLDRRSRRLLLVYGHPRMHDAVLDTGRFHLVRVTGVASGRVSGSVHLYWNGVGAL